MSQVKVDMVQIYLNKCKNEEKKLRKHKIP